MNYQDRELLVSRIVSGRTFLYCNKKGYIYFEPDVFTKSYSIERSARTHKKAIKNGLMSGDELLPFLHSADLWTEEEEKSIKKIEKDIDEFKIQLFNLRAKKKEVEYLKRNIEEARKQLDVLMMKKGQFFRKTAESAANEDKMRYLIGVGLYHSDGVTRVWPGNSFWKDRSNLLEKIILKYLRARPSQIQIRELARSDPWRGMWAAREAVQNIFPVMGASLSDDQRHLVMWTRIYDNAREDQDGPGEEAINDDDMFDGWMILRRQKSETERNANNKLASLTNNEKILNSDNIFIAYGDEMSPEEIDEIYNLNGEDGKKMIRRRFNKIDKLGQVSEFAMPDQLENMQMMRNRNVGGG